MRICSPALFYDAEDHIWKFYVNEDKNLMYSIMYAEDKWTKENKIDNEVLDFSVNLDVNNRIGIIYSVRSGDLKYCVWEDNKCFGKTIYKSENEGYEMTELKVITIDKLMHIFFIGKNIANKIQCSLNHLCLNKDDSIFNTIDTIPFSENTFCHYQVQNLENGNLSLIFIKSEKTEVVLIFTEYKNNKWSIPKRLYGIVGESINFCTLLQLDKINIMNLSKEGSLNFIEHVIIEPDGKMRNYKIHETFQNPANFSLIEISGVLWAMWSEGENVFASSYKEKWNEPIKSYSKLYNKISIYKYLSLSDKNENIKCKYILGTNPPEMNLLLPNSQNDNYTDSSKETNKVGTKTELDYDVEKDKIYMKQELLFLQNSNRDLEKKLIDLQMKLQQKTRILEETEDTFAKLTNTRKKAEEKLKIISQIQQNSMKKMKSLEADKMSKDEVINELTNKTQQLHSEYEKLNEQKIFKDNVVTELKNKLQQLASEKEGLWQDLKYEKNIGIVDRIFKKKVER